MTGNHRKLNWAAVEVVEKKKGIFDHFRILLITNLIIFNFCHELIGINLQRLSSVSLF